MKKIRFQGQKYVFVGDSLEKGGAIAAQEDYETGRTSYAHLYPSGEVNRFGEQIGTVEDIEVVGDVEPEIDLGKAFHNMLANPLEWRRP